MFKKISLSAFIAAALVACGGGGGDDEPPQVGTDACSLTAQKQFVLDAMRDVYFWNTSLPADVDIAAFATPEALLDHLISFSPISPITGEPVDRFSFITTAAADQAFFGEGQFEGFGFSWRFETATEIRFTRVFSDSPAAMGGFERGQRIVALDGMPVSEILASQGAVGISAMFDRSPLEFTLEAVDGTPIAPVTVTQGIVTIDPLPQWRVIDYAGGGAGYIEFAQFISTAEPEFDTIFAALRQANISDLIVDMRYNGGGLVRTAELMGDYLGGRVAGGLVFSKTLFNENNSASNSIRNFIQLTNSLSLSRLIVIATQGTASASELVANGLDPHVAMIIVGDRTFGKPVGQVGIEFCEKLLRATAFETVNALDEGDFFDGLPVDCPAEDNVFVPVGDVADPNVAAALTYLETGACPVVVRSLKLSQPGQAVPEIDWRGPAHREFGRAF